VWRVASSLSCKGLALLLDAVVPKFLHSTFLFTEIVVMEKWKKNALSSFGKIN
jgi:hypothetical protein